MKNLYCRECGGKLDENKKCTNCTKQYFYLSTINLITIVLTLFSMFCLCLYYQVSQHLNTVIDDLEISKQTINTLSSEKINYSKLYSNILNKVSFFEDKSIIINNSTPEIYHKYDCLKVQVSRDNCSIYSIEDIKTKNLKPCDRCH